MDEEKLKKIISTTKKLNALYIEDNSDVREQTLKMLNLFFNSVTIGKNGKEGFELFKENPSFDLIITDIEMPEIDGITMINSIREIDKKVPILIFSAHSTTDYFIKTIDAGIIGYILKPYDVNQISNSLLKLIDREDHQEDDKLFYLDDDYIWNNEENALYKNGKLEKLTKSEIKLFELFSNSKCTLKSYEEIELSVFGDMSSNSKRVRNLMSRLKTKLDFDLFESIYGHGYKIKQKKE
ncbi:response regulator transcription factor [Halarcobacter ebronensis]|uniref:Response regulator receiver protein n=1 Tax=Halarcobacter ebronensis TaxID=1462615 RepID=A0A4Q1AJF8_9BACT|nr:response regulator [Halarcobacter ebronensis]QKF81926.1 signal transduction response regulator, OmpR family [Halarcobacter ebronensis]RXK04355.1 response regulator receiver protein [Halarcobacter ebronensis]